MPYTVVGYEVVGTIKENESNLQIVKHKVKYVPAILSAKELSDLCENVYHGSLNIKNKEGLYEYIDNACYNYDIGLSQKFDVIQCIFKKRKDIL